MTAMVVRAVALRVTFPYELEWMGGSVLDHVDRVRAGLPVYTQPTTRWIPYLYPPLYYWIAARLGGGFLACRLLSLAAAGGQAACIGWLARRAGATPYWTSIAVLLFFSAFFYVGYWYDIERSDTLCVALVLLANVVLSRRRTVLATVSAGAILGLAFFAKQQAFPFLLAALVALLLERDYRRALVVAGVGGAMMLGITRWQDAASGGWFSYYVWKMPAAHGLDLRLWRDVVEHDLIHGVALVAVTLTLGVTFVRDAWRGERQNLLFVAMLLAGAATSLTSRFHFGGWRNTLEFWTAYACTGTALLATRAEAWLERRSRPRLACGIYGAVFLQLALWIHSPSARVPDPALRGDTERLVRTIARLDESGETLVVGRGHLTVTPHFQMSALADVVRVAGPPSDLVDALRTRRLAAIVDDARRAGETRPALWPAVMLEDIDELRAPLFANYYVAERIDDEAGRLVMPILTSPRWVYRPRVHPLLEGDASLTRRHFAEMRLAERRSALVRAGKPVPYAAEDIEGMAAR
jgi:hypothetical protein